MKIRLLKAVLWVFLLISAVAIQAQTDLTLETGVAPHAKIDGVYKQFSEAYRKLDPQMVSNLYTENAFYLVPSSEVKRGRQTILAEFTRFFEMVKSRGGSVNISFQILDRQVSGDLAYDVGIYTITQKDSKGEPHTGRGKFVVVIKRVKNDEWQFQVDGYNEFPEKQNK